MPPPDEIGPLFLPLKRLSSPNEISDFSRSQKALGKKVGFVPTMGALHAGHISLIQAAKATCDVVIASVFVNPTQFNDPSDFERYPRVVEKDATMLEEAGCDVVFLPEVKDMYPDESSRLKIDFGYIETVLEGKHRPGHFSGVGMVVKRFFEIVQPDVAFFGKKDFQQVMIIRALVEKFSFPIQIVALETKREADGLAMSSRNLLLSETDRQIALHLSRVLREAKAEYSQMGVELTEKSAIEKLNHIEGLRLEYFSICNSKTLKPVLHPESEPAVALVAAFVGKVRLIDNMELFSL